MICIKDYLTSKGEVDFEKTEQARQQIEYLELAQEGLEACMSQIAFNICENERIVYYGPFYEDNVRTIGKVSHETGVITFYDESDETKEFGKCNMMNLEEIYNALNDDNIKAYMEEFLRAIIEDFEAD